MRRAKLLISVFVLSLMLGTAPAWADVDISGKTQITVDSWEKLKNAVETAAADTVIVLTADIQADIDNPITEVGSSGIIIDGGGFTITGQEGSYNGQFINFDSKDTTDLIIQNVKFDGFGNVKTGSSDANGGAIYNRGTIGDISGDFEENYAQGKYASGGAIYNYYGTIGDITGDFSGNYAQSTSGCALGGAIYNYGTVGDISGDFSSNYVQADSIYAQGGAIYNWGTIGDITGDFSDNYVQAHSSASGGAIYNLKTIGDIIGDFSDNYTQSVSDSASGGAIYNNSNIGDIIGEFTGNFVQSTSGSAIGGAIYNLKTIGNFGGAFTGNYAKSDSSSVYGGAIYNRGTIGDITGDFINNYAQSNSKYAQGGVIHNGSSASIGNITGDFSGNYAQGSSAYGGVIYNEKGIISNITGDFSDNYALGSSAYGGVIYNEKGTIGDIRGTFTNNNAQGFSADGGVIYNEKGTIGDITGDFSGNYAQSDSVIAHGGAVLNRSSIGDITGDFSGNYARSDSYFAYGGAIYNDGSIGNITSDFIGNYAQSDSKYVSGGAIHNGYFGTIGDITGNFTDNYVQSTSSYAQGGAVFNDEKPLTFINSSFYDNYVETGAEKESEAGQQTQGGAIYSIGDLTIRADNGQSIFRGNKVIWSDGVGSSAIMAPKLKLDSLDGGLIQFDDKISGYKELTRMYQSEVNDIIYELEYMGLEIKQEDENYFASGILDGFLVSYQFIKQDDDAYIMTYLSGDMIITGDGSSKVVFNNAIENFNTIDISGTNVDVNEGAGTIYRTVTHDGGVLNINAGVKSEDSVINDKGTMNVANTAEVNRTEVNEGGTLHVAAGGLAQDTTVNSGGTLITEDQAKVNNMQANEGANLEIDAGSILTGNIIINADANMSGSYDYSKIFKDEVTDDGSLTLVGGLNEVLNENSLVNSTSSKRLHLTAGDYVIGEGAQSVLGWDMLTFKDNANVKLQGDIALSEATKKIIIENGSSLDLAGNSPSNYQIVGSISNDGSMTFTHAGDDADDITTIYGNYTAYNNAQMTIDVNPTANTSDLLRIEGDVAGTTTVNLNFVNGEAETSKKIPFVEAPNDNLDTGAYFVINRVVSNAFVWNSLYQDGVWYVGTDNVIPDANNEGYGTSGTGALEDDENLEADAVLPPNFPDVPVIGDNIYSPSVVGEAIAYMGLPSAGIEQTRDMTRNITNKVAATKVYSQKCEGFYDCGYDGKLLRNVWFTPVYSYSDVEAPYSYESDITGFEGGGDFQSDVYNRLGIYASYRHGSYDFDGNGDDYYSKVGADMDIDSYILGLYHRYDQGKMWAMSQIFFGYQDVAMSSDDGVSTDTSGIEFGAAIEGGLIFNPMTDLTIEPLFRLSYTQINYDDATDNYGKTASYGDVSNLEIEAGVKVEKTYLRKNGYAKVYVKPSIIQNIGSGDVTVTSLRQVDGLENSTLGRIEVGGAMSFDEQWSGYANAAYTFGSDYTNLGLNAGLNYAF